MWFRRQPRVPTRAERWAAFATTLGAQPYDGGVERLRRFFDLDDAELPHAYARRDPEGGSLVLFDVVRRRRGPTGEVVRWSTWVSVRRAGSLATVPFRATPRRGSVLESLEASRSGAVRVDLSSYPEVDAAVAVFARDAVAARASLRPEVTELLRRLVAVGPGAWVTVGHQHLIAGLDVQEAGDPAAIAGVVRDVRALARALAAPHPVAIEERDFLPPSDASA